MLPLPQPSEQPSPAAEPLELPRRRTMLRAISLVVVAVPVALGGESLGVCQQPSTSNANGEIQESDEAIQTVVEEYSTDGVAGYTTYRVAVKLQPAADNIYTILCVWGRLLPAIRGRACRPPRAACLPVALALPVPYAC